MFSVFYFTLWFSFLLVGDDFDGMLVRLETANESQSRMVNFWFFVINAIILFMASSWLVTNHHDKFDDFDFGDMRLTVRYSTIKSTVKEEKFDF